MTDHGRLLESLGLPRTDSSPSPAAKGRIAAAVLAAHMDAAVGREVRIRSTQAPARTFWWRRTMAVVVAAGAVLACVTGALAVSGPGHPLYGARLALEVLILPSADTSDRVDAQFARLQSRLSEATEAVQRTEPRALEDALGAYRDALADIAAFGARHPGARPGLGELLARNERALTSLLARTATAMRGPVDAAIVATVSARRTVNENACWSLLVARGVGATQAVSPVRHLVAQQQPDAVSLAILARCGQTPHIRELRRR